MWEIFLNFDISFEERSGIFVLRAQSGNVTLYMHTDIIEYLDAIFLKLSEQMKNLSDSVLCWILIISTSFFFFTNLVNQLLNTAI